MTTPADDLATEAAFEAFLVGRVVPEQAANTFDGVAAFAGAVRANATQPGRPNAALAELLATGLLADQSSPSARTAGAAGALPSRRARIRRRRFAMFLPALVAKLLAAGAVAQAATGAGVVLVVATGAGATGLLGTGVQDTLASSVGADSTDSEVTKQDDVAVTDDQTADPGTVDGTEGDTTVPVEPVQETVDPETWVADGPGDNETFGAWVSASAHNDQLREWLRSQGKTFGSMVSEWAHKKGLDGADLEREGVDLDDLSDEPTPSPVTSGPGAGTDDQGDDGTQVASTHRGSGKSGSDGQGKSGGSSNGKSGNSGNGRSGNSGRGHN